MRVHELAKELNISSKELLEYLSSKNDKIKTSSNSVTDEEAADARKRFTKTEAKAEVKEEKEEIKEETKAPAPVKKKIVAVYNPQNSGRKDIREQQRRNENRNGQPRQAEKPQNVKPIDRPQGIRPIERPEGAIRPSDRVGMKPDRPQGERPQRPQGDRPQRPQGDKFRGGKPDFNKDKDEIPNNNRRPGGNFRKDDRNNSAFDGGEAIKDREAKEQRNRDRENRKRDNNFHDKTEKMENTKALEKNLMRNKKKEEEEETIKTLVLPDVLTIKDLADKMKIPCLHFILNDKEELLHNNQLTLIARIVEEQKNVQYVSSILTSKLPDGIDVKRYQVLTLSETNKLFKLPD